MFLTSIPALPDNRGPELDRYVTNVTRCHRKRYFATRAKANKARREWGGRAMNVYHCKYCGGYHLGSRENTQAPKEPTMDKFKTSKICPKCGEGAKLILRVDRQTGERLLSCPNWPACEYAEEIPEDMRMKLAGASRLPGF